MPSYRGELELEDAGPDTPVVHLFDYCNHEDQTNNKSSYYRKQLVALDSCIFVGRRSLSQVKSKSKQQTSIKNPNTKSDPKDILNNNNDEKDIKNDSRDTVTEDTPANMTNGHVISNGTSALVSNGEGLVHNKDDGDEGEEVVEAPLLKEGQEFEGYFLKCPNGPYDYATKIWTKGKAAPREEQYPTEGHEVEALVIDRNGDYLTIACGPNIAYATKKSFLVAGVDPDDLSLPFARLRVSLTKAPTRPQEVPAAAWIARPTQVVVPPYDIY